MSELADVVHWCDMSLHSERATLDALEQECCRQNKTHRVIVMADLGDLREGFWDKDEMAEVCRKVEFEMDNLHLSGIGTNLGCYGSIDPTVAKEQELVDVAEKIEAVIGRQLEIISGGGTTSLPRVWKGDMPPRINMLRVGEGVLLARDLELFYNCPQPELMKDNFRLKAEVIEVKDKPSHPVGEIAVDAFGHKPTYVDRGIRKRALLGIGKVDYASIDEIFPMEEGVEILGASSDHTILDIEDSPREWKVGDIVEFEIDYASLVFLTNTRNVHIVFK
jgi:predicted amino acid racemase